MEWSLGVVLLLFTVCCLAAVLGSLVSFALLARKTLALEFDLSDLQQRLLREVKTRAANESVKKRSADDELLQQVLQSKQNKPPQGPWWLEHVHPDLTGKQ